MCDFIERLSRWNWSSLIELNSHIYKIQNPLFLTFISFLREENIEENLREEKPFSYSISWDNIGKIFQFIPILYMKDKTSLQLGQIHTDGNFFYEINELNFEFTEEKVFFEFCKFFAVFCLKMSLNHYYNLNEIM